MEREKRTILVRLRRNLRRMVTRPFKVKQPAPMAEEDLQDLEDFTGLSREEVLPWVRRERGRRISNEFDWLAPRSAREYGWFYRGSRTYLFNADTAWERALEVVQPGWRVLDFGGGGGRNSLGMAARGAKVFYVDIAVLSAAFTAFRARKRGLDVTIVDPLVQVDGRWVVDTAEAGRRVGELDLIVCDNVLEHVADYPSALRKLAAGLGPSGRILECTPFKREKTYILKRQPEWDIHLPPPMPMSAAMAACGMRPVEGAEPGLWERAR